MSKSKNSKFYNEIKSAGYKLTSQRKIIIDLIVKNSDKHMTTKDIFGIVSKKHPEIGLATVYRTVTLFEEVGILTKLNFGEDFVYEIADEDGHNHHHLICSNCGKIIEMKFDLLDDLENKICEMYKFKISNHTVKFYGVCEECFKNDIKNGKLDGLL